MLLRIKYQSLKEVSWDKFEPFSRKQDILRDEIESIHNRVVSNIWNSKSEQPNT